MIYGVIEEGDETTIKVGYTGPYGVSLNDAVVRVRGLQVGNRRPLVIVAAAVGERFDETALHKQFEKHRIAGEWFETKGPVSVWFENHRLDEPIKIRSVVLKKQRPAPKKRTSWSWRGQSRSW
jgi:hypothetical protein